ncbi:MAG TPA: hypothetical protein DCF42_05825, partial [Lachnospiraceae bacterium]|nr:hypothetical protein [Lachnospiraceae bacterium]
MTRSRAGFFCRVRRRPANRQGGKRKFCRTRCQRGEPAGRETAVLPRRVQFGKPTGAGSSRAVEIRGGIRSAQQGT